MSSQQTSSMASPTLGKPGQGARSPASWRLDKGPLSVLHNAPLSSALGRTMQLWPGEAEDKGPFVRTVPT